MSQTRSRRIVITVGMLLGMLALSSTSALAQPTTSHSTTPVPDVCGPPGALPGVFRCESQMTQIDGDYYYSLDFINKFRARFPDTTLDNNQIAQGGHGVCQSLKQYGLQAVVEAFVNAGWGVEGTTWVVATSKHLYCPSLS
ncbi:DUF732 domain-containing protein [Streptomyces sp. NPDC058642]|uniref:DUF732 domain-containing protein n=1 Tax=Streptomyces sp. NPDC058642 TaxID=3346572 RepID=UPI00365B9D7E